MKLNEKRLTKVEQIELGRLIKEGNQRARDYLVACSYWVAESLAEKFRDDHNSFEDLTQAGCLGLMIAVDKYNPEKNINFGCFAVWYVRQAIDHYKKNQSPIVTFSHLGWQRMTEIRKKADELYRILQRQPTLVELSEATGYDSQLIGMALEHYMSQDGKPDVREECTVDENAMSEEILNKVRGALYGFSDIEMYVVNNRLFQIHGYRPTLTEIARHYKMSRTYLVNVENRVHYRLKTRIGREFYDEVIQCA